MHEWSTCFRDVRARSGIGRDVEQEATEVVTSCSQRDDKTWLQDSVTNADVLTRRSQRAESRTVARPKSGVADDVPGPGGPGAHTAMGARPTVPVSTRVGT